MTTTVEFPTSGCTVNCPSFLRVYQREKTRAKLLLDSETQGSLSDVGVEEVDVQIERSDKKRGQGKSEHNGRPDYS